MNFNFANSETQKLSMVSGSHDFLKRIHKSLRKTTFVLRFICLIVSISVIQQAVAQTPQYHNQDNIIVQRYDGKGGIIKGADGLFYVWGHGAFQKTNPNYNKYLSNRGTASNGDAEFLEPLTNANGFVFTGNILKATMVGSSEASGTYINTDRLILTDNDKLWFIPSGDNTYQGGYNFGITVTDPTGSHTGSQVMEAKLPVGVTAAQVSYLNGGSAKDSYSGYGYRSIYLIANGNVYIASDKTESASGAVAKVVDANGWEKVMVSAGVALSNVKWVSEYKSGEFAAYTTNDEIYIWGSNSGTNAPGWTKQTGGYPNTNQELFLPVGATWNNYYANKAKNPPVPFTMFNVGPHFISGLGTDGVLYHVGQVLYGKKLSRTAISTWTYNNQYYYNTGLNPNKWQQAFYDNDPGNFGVNKWYGHNEIWRPQYYITSDTVDGMKFYQSFEGVGDLAIRNEADHHVMYFVNGGNQYTGSSLGGQSYSANVFTPINDATQSNWNFATSDTRLAYVANSKVLPNFPNFGLTNDGSVCVTGHTAGSDFYGTGYYTMGIFSRIDHQNSYMGSAGGIPQGGWKCGKAKKADGSSFVAAGAITSNTTGSVGAGTIDCAKTQLSPAPVSGTPSQLSLIVTVNVTTAGSFPLTVTGSGFTLANGITSVTAATTGVKQFVIPINYDGTALGSLTFTVGSAGSCSADLSTIASRPVNKLVLTLDNCAAITPGTISK
jgi:hypothetical protein